MVTADTGYLHHRGKPLVAVWGIGFNDGRDYSLRKCLDLVTSLKAGGCSVMLGLPSFRREGQRDATDDPLLHRLVKEADVVSPWTVGRYRTPDEAARHAETVWRADREWCQREKLDFLPVIFPGFSWHNLQGGTLDQIPRRKGEFFWSQALARQPRKIEAARPRTPRLTACGGAAGDRGPSLWSPLAGAYYNISIPRNVVFGAHVWSEPMMSAHIRLLLLAATLSVVTTNDLCLAQTPVPARTANQQPSTSGNSPARFATDDFVAGCRVLPKALIAHEYFGSLPIDALLPPSVSLGRLDAMGFEELVVFCGPTADQQLADGSALEWAAAARTARPIEVQAAMKQWRESLISADAVADAESSLVKLEDIECYRVAAGSFLETPRRYGKLRFTDRNGDPSEKGINVGYEYEYRSYVEGASGSSAIVTLDQIDETDFIDGHLPLEIRPNVFRTYHLPSEYSTALVELRNPETGLVSQPVTFHPKSYVNHCLDVPRRITAAEAGTEKQLDILKDLVSRAGQLEVILKVKEPGAYLGVGPYDVNVRPNAFEYVYISDREFVVAQSARTLSKMLRAAATPAALATRLSQAAGDIAVVASVQTPSQRDAFRQLARVFGDSRPLELWGDALKDATATIQVNEPTMARVRAEFNDARSADGALDGCRQWMRSAQADAHANIGDSLIRLDVLSNLMSLEMNGVVMRFPDQDKPTAEARKLYVLGIIDDALNSIRLETADKVLTAEFVRPEVLSRLPESALIAVANVEELLARDLFSREKFDLGDEMFRRVTNRFPLYPQTWFRRAHHLAYNASVELDGYATRYAWVSRGVHVLLDGAEQNPETLDLNWMAARVIGWKVGTADDRAAYRRLFSNDKRLHERIARIIDLDQARSPDQAVDNWLVAKLLSEHCLDRQAKAAAATIPPLLFFSQPAGAQAQYAQALSESGRWNEARSAWQEAERLFKEFGGRTVLLSTSDRVRLNDLQARREELGPDHESVKRLENLRSLVLYDYWLARCQLEQTEAVQSVRKLARQAAEHALRSDPKMAYDAYRQALRTLANVHEQQPAPTTLIANDFAELASGYRLAAEQVSAPDDAALAPLLTLIEQTRSPSWLYLLEPTIRENEFFPFSR
jgi:hypothetical protein